MIMLISTIEELDCFFIICFKTLNLGGERIVTELLEKKSRKQLNESLLEEGGNENHEEVEQRSFGNFFFQPGLLGKDLFSIIKFGLVQYVRP